ncbi:MAG: D-alanyl-D-alanine carboxypeptidase [Oscillospiraceae bacterium]|nr:D-alanyl-D-alanine carboxypeptidase [Oscillospiraceae bacterium]
MNKKFVKYIISIIITLTICSVPVALATEVGGQSITSKGAIIIDFETGMEIFAYNADERLNPASMTKMMTVYLVYEAIAAGDIDLDTKVPISAATAEFSRNPNETNVPLTTTGNYTVTQLLDAVIVVSAGGAAYALAELVGGSRPNFIVKMNEKVAEWEIDAHFTSVSGGPRETYVTPRAMATITRKTIQNFPEVLEKTTIKSLRFSGWDYPSTNELLGSYEGLDGFKTGTNSVAGACFTSTAQRGDTRLITVTMGSSTRSSRFADTRIMLNYGFAFMEEYNANQTPPPTETPTLPPDESPPPTEDPGSTPDPNDPTPPGETPTPSPTPNSLHPPNTPGDGSDDSGLSRPMLVLLIAGGYAVLCIIFYAIYKNRRKNNKWKNGRTKRQG